jgi:hypothetical protein
MTSLPECGGPILDAGHAGVGGNEIADELARGGSAVRFLAPEPALGISWRDIQKTRSRFGQPALARMARLW